jgi:hypothetical protein
MDYLLSGAVAQDLTGPTPNVRELALKRLQDLCSLALGRKHLMLSDHCSLMGNADASESEKREASLLALLQSDSVTVQGAVLAVVSFLRGFSASFRDTVVQVAVTVLSSNDHRTRQAAADCFEPLAKHGADLAALNAFVVRLGRFQNLHLTP